MAQAAKPHSIPVGRSQILCVDSDAPGLALLDAVLGPRGYDVVSAANGKEALEVLLRQQVDLILLGAILPNVDGFTVCLQLRLHERFRDIPIVMMSAIKSREDVIRAIESGADDYLFKPLDHDVMLARVKMLVERKRKRDRRSRFHQNSTLLTAASNDIIDGLTGAGPDIDAGIEKLVLLQTRKTMDMVEKPRTVIVGMAMDGSTWNWHHYEYAFHELSRVKIDFNPVVGISMPEKGQSKLIVLTGPQLEPEARILIKNFQARNISVENGIVYLTRDFCILAVNYGQDIEEDHIDFLLQMTVQSRLMYLLAGQTKETAKAYDYGIYALARAAEVHDDDTGNHALRVGDYCGVLAERLGMKGELARLISVQSVLHDVGKIYTPTSILKKTEPLTAEEWVEMKKHTLWGAKIIGGNPYLHIAQSVALNHHEKWDGSGYPRGLKGDAIPPEGRIAALADQYDALRIARIHKPALDHASAVKVLNHGDGRIKPQHFDPQVLKAFRETAFLFEDIFERRKG